MSELIKMSESEREPAYVFERKEPRSKTRPFKLSVVGECGKLYGYVRDMSASGLQVRTFKSCEGLPKRAGETLTLSLKLPGSDPVECRARIRWSRSQEFVASGVEMQGLEFVEPSNEARVVISRLIKTYRVD